MATKLPKNPLSLSNEAYENVCKCRFTSSTDKVAYLVAITKFGTDTKLAEKFHSKFRRGRLRKGIPPNKLLPSEGLGVLMSEVSFLRNTASAFGMSPIKFEKVYRRWIAYEQKRIASSDPTQSEIDAGYVFRRARIPARQDGEIWLFRHPKRNANAFHGLINKWLGARLGLNIIPGETRLTFSFAASHVDNPVLPSFLDATWGYLSKWHWAGQTRPLPGTPKRQQGLEELVCDPPQLRDLNTPVSVITIVKRK